MGSLGESPDVKKVREGDATYMEGEGVYKRRRCMKACGFIGLG